MQSSGKFTGYSAGAAPSGRVNPFAHEVALDLGYDGAKLRSKSWDEFSIEGVPKMDIIITVCDDAAGETCPLWLGSPTTAHWGFADPSRDGSDDEKRAAFAKVAEGLRVRIEKLAALDLDAMDIDAQRAAIAEIHRTS